MVDMKQVVGPISADVCKQVFEILKTLDFELTPMCIEKCLWLNSNMHIVRDALEKLSDFVVQNPNTDVSFPIQFSDMCSVVFENGQETPLILKEFDRFVECSERFSSLLISMEKIEIQRDEKEILSYIY
jgi:hypothetical protein